MKSSGLMAIACAAALTVACTGEVREDNRPVNETEEFDTAEDRDITGDRVGTTGAERDPAEATGGAGVSGEARAFVEKAAHGGMTEVQLGQLASERAQNAEVKKFGQMMVRDHTKSSEELKQAVVRYNVQVPAELDQEHKDTVEKLRNLRGAEFDREYMSVMVDSHREMQGLLEDRVEDGRSTAANSRTENQNAEGLKMALDQWATKAKSSVDQHLRTAEQLQQKLQNNRNNTN